jgi:hypothetical protein
MPVEIREMVIRASLPEEKSNQGYRDGESDEGRDHGTQNAQAINQDQVVQACVEAVMRILERKARK